MKCQILGCHAAYGPLSSHQALEVGPDIDRAVLVAIEGDHAVPVFTHDTAVLKGLKDTAPGLVLGAKWNA